MLIRFRTTDSYHWTGHEKHKIWPFVPHPGFLSPDPKLFLFGTYLGEGNRHHSGKVIQLFFFFFFPFTVFKFLGLTIIIFVLIKITAYTSSSSNRGIKLKTNDG